MSARPLPRQGEFQVGQIWRQRSSLPGVWRFRITRLAGRSAFGELTVNTLPWPSMRTQKKYSQLRAKWELEKDSEDTGADGVVSDREPSPVRQEVREAAAPDTCEHDYEYLERQLGETYTGYCEKCTKCDRIVQVPQ